METTMLAIAAAALLAAAAAAAALFRSALLVLGEDRLAEDASAGGRTSQGLLAAIRDPALRHPFSLWVAQAGLKIASALCAGAAALGLAERTGGVAGAAAAAGWIVLFLGYLFLLENLAGRGAMEDPRGILRRWGRLCLFALRAAAVPARGFDRAGRLLFGERYSPEALMDVRFGSEEGILDVVEEGAEHGTIDDAEERMIEGVLRSGEIPVSGVMTPWSRVVALREGMSADDIAAIAGETGFSRYPVLSAGGAEIVGILETRALFRAESPFRLERHLLKPVYVPESMKVSDLSRQFRRAGVHMAVAIDEHGKLCGVITPGDLMARIMGRLDEGDGAREAPEWEKDVALSVPGATPVRVLREEYGIDIPAGPHYETAAGFAMDRLQHIPEAPVTFLEGGYRITVSGIDRYRIARLRFEKAGTPGVTGTS